MYVCTYVLPFHVSFCNAFSKIKIELENGIIGNYKPQLPYIKHAPIVSSMVVFINSANAWRLAVNKSAIVMKVVS